MSKPKYKLTYYNLMGIGEPIRLLFAYKKESFEDFRIDHDDWETAKSTPWGCVPVLEWTNEEGKVEQLSQSFAILRFLGRNFNLAGSNDLEMAKCEEFMEAMSDVVRDATKMYFEKDEVLKDEMKKRLREEMLPRFASRMAVAFKENGSGVLVGKEPTIADLYVAHMMSRITNEDETFKQFPEICKHTNYILNLPGIKEYIASRPITAV